MKAWVEKNLENPIADGFDIKLGRVFIYWKISTVTKLSISQVSRLNKKIDI